MNNKGQTLVLFILILPIMLLLFVFLIDIGVTMITKQRIENNVSLALTYGVNHFDEENIDNKIKDMIIQNMDNIDLSNIDIDTKENKMIITINMSIRSNILSREEQLTITQEKEIGVNYGNS